ncbi:MAG: acetolactate synthase large subunit, partial [Spirochaetaceae bacterium]|nr:acetolactate synthase large subunit [Spirochaetaceae bacterium]
MKYSGAHILIESLIAEGVDTIFGYPGGAVLFIYDELYKYQDKIKHILVSHEQHAAHAADAYSRATGKTGVCLATSGPGATNLVTGIATAYMDSVPLVAITGNVATDLLGKDSFQEVDIAGITMPVVKHNWIVKNINELSEIIREAFIVANSGRPGPVLIDIPKDITLHTTEWEPKRNTAVDSAVSERAKRLSARNTMVTWTDDDIKIAQAKITGSKRPVIFAGGGVVISDAWKELAELAQRIDAPVASSLMALGAFPCTHKLWTGMIGMHGTVASNKAVQNSDLLITIGARFSDRVISHAGSFAPNAEILQFDIDPAEVNKNIAVSACVIGNIKKTLQRTLSDLPKMQPKDSWTKKIAEFKTQIPQAHKERQTLTPRFVIKEAAKKFGDDT